MPVETNKRTYYLDLLKILAAVFVVVIHVTAQNWSTDTYNIYWLVNNSYNSLSRWSVPMFVMVSGALLLTRDIPLKKIFTKYVLRIFLLLMIWGVYYRLSQTRDISFKGLWEAVMKVFSGGGHYHLWYLYMLLGLYIITPVIRVFVKNASPRDIDYWILLLFVVQVLLPYLHKAVPELTAFYKAIKIAPFSEYLVYYLAGYRLSQYDLSRGVRIALYCGAAVFLLGAMVRSDILSYRQQEAVVNSGVLSMGTFLFSCSLFALCRQLEDLLSRTWMSKAVAFLAPLTFGIYLMHPKILELFAANGLHGNAIHPILGVPLVTLGVFVSAGAVAWVFSKIPVLRKLIK